MSSLESRIEADLHAAMSARDAARVSALRMLKSSVKYAAIEKKTAALSDADVRQVVQKQIKQRRESIDQFTKAGRAELAAAETREAEILESYLPQQMSDPELAEAVAKAVKKAGAPSKKDFGRLMKVLNETLGGRAEARRISEALGKHLS